jgi:predicted transposase/invertase (TIGR01784 family)
MKESVIYQAILLEGMAEGIAEGRAKGIAEGIAEGKAKGIAETTKQIALNMLRSNIAIDLVVQITGLSLKQVQKLQKTSTKPPKNAESPKRSPR